MFLKQSFLDVRRLLAKIYMQFEMLRFSWDARECLARSSSREIRIRVPFLSVVYFNRGTLPKKQVGQRALLGT